MIVMDEIDKSIIADVYGASLLETARELLTTDYCNELWLAEMATLFKKFRKLYDEAMK
jgi:hypothetical protein